jgi:hypothetical protein
VLCDGIVSRTQIYVEPGLDFGVDVEASLRLDWRVLVTRRGGRLRYGDRVQGSASTR